VSHPNTIGGVKIVGPDVAHPNFARWERDSSSFPQEVLPLTTPPGPSHAD
jgi:hypothetical protein